jgi:hypothetical protein
MHPEFAPFDVDGARYPDPTLNELLNDALLMWADVCDIDFTDDSYAFSFGDQFTPDNLRKLAKEISAARDLDPTGLTSWMMLRGIWEAYLNQFTFTAYQIITDRGPVEALVSKMTSLRDLLESDRVVSLISAFEDKLRDVATGYGITDLEPLAKLLADKWSLAYVRRDALLALDRLSAHQFCQGDPETDQLGYNENIVEFWNVNSLLRAMRSQPKAGTTVCLIRDPVALWSYCPGAPVRRSGQPLLVPLPARRGRGLG